jgi:hypothetical protein
MLRNGVVPKGAFVGFLWEDDKLVVLVNEKGCLFFLSLLFAVLEKMSSLVAGTFAPAMNKSLKGDIKLPNILPFK